MKINEFWNQFGIKGESLMVILRILKKTENRELPNIDKMNIVKKIYFEKVKKDQYFVDNEVKKLNNAKFKLGVENNRLLKRKTEEKFFKCEDNIQDYEDFVMKKKKIINDRLIILNKNKIILNNLERCVF